MYCVSCRRSTSLPGARYCAHCGAPLEAPLWSGAATLALEEDEAPGIQVDCPSCRKASAEGNAHCVYCGSRMDGAGRKRARNEADALRAEELVSTARAQLASGAKEQAEASCREAVLLDPANAAGYALLAETYWQKGSLGGALQAMTTAVRLDPTNQEWERRLRELRDEQDKAVAPVLREWREPPRRRFVDRSRPPLRLPQAPAKLPQAPTWLPPIALILGVMLLLALLPRALTGGMMMGLGWVIGVLAAVFVYRDALAQRMSQPVALLWAVVVFFSRGLALLVYLLITRARR